MKIKTRDPNRRAHGHTCAPDIGGDGDVAVCLRCGQWWDGAGDGVGMYVFTISPAEAGRRARAPMDPEEVLAAFEDNEQRMMLEVNHG